MTRTRGAFSAVARQAQNVWSQLVAAHPLGSLNPVEGFMMLAVALQGAMVLLGIAGSTTIDQALSPVMRALWAGCLLLGGSAALLGMSWPGNAFEAIRIKRAGLIFAGSATLAYGVALAALGTKGWFVAAGNLGFSISCAVMIVKINKALRDANDHLAHLRRHRRGR